MVIEGSHDYRGGGTERNEYAPEDVVEVPCPLCGASRSRHLYTEYEILEVVRCGACSLVYTSPRLREPERIYWGDRQEYREEARLIFEGTASHHRDPNYLEELDILARHREPGRLLDVGCNMGMLLRLARDRGWEAVGVEPSPALASLAREELDLPVHQDFLHEISPDDTGRFDAVALSDVLEHITDPLPFLRDARRFLAPGGILFVKVPNARWNLLKQRVLALVGRRPRQGVWDAYEHVVHYTDTTLSRLLSDAGFAVVQMTHGRPVQVPVWHLHVGRYYQYPSPWCMDWRRYAARRLLHWLSWPERWLRLGTIGSLASNIIAVATAGED